MVGGSFGLAKVVKERAKQYQGRVTCYVIVACLIIAIGGFTSRYNSRISGGVTPMDSFMEKFFYTVSQKKMHELENNYCKYNNQGLSAITFSVYLTGLVASLIASPIIGNYGRQTSIICGGISFLVGATLNAITINLAMLLSGRI